MSSQKPPTSMRVKFREEMEVFMFAGHDTTTAAGSFTLNFIAENPRVLKNCRKELQEVFGASGRQPTYSDLSKLTYLNACIRESLRLRAPVREYFRFIIIIYILTLRRPLRKKLPMRWFFDVSKLKESSFF